MKNKQLRKWALGAEIVSAVAIVVTIGFLAIQTMENTNALQAQTYQQLQSELNAYRAIYAGSESNLTKALINAQNELDSGGMRSLSEDAYWLIFNNSTILWGIYESAYFANKRGVLGEQEWSRFESAICRKFDGDGPLWNIEGRFTSTSEYLTKIFVDYVEVTCK